MTTTNANQDPHRPGKESAAEPGSAGIASDGDGDAGSVERPAESTPPGEGCAGRSPLAWIVLLGVLALGVGVDLWSKAYAFAHVADRPVVLDRRIILDHPDWHPPMHEPVVFVPKVLQFRLVLNRGAVFGIGPGHRWFFVAFTVVAVTVALGIFAWRTGRRQRAIHVALACILAGALGNLYDRIVFGAVRDFFHMLPDVRLPFGWRWPNGSSEVFPWVFNVADVLLLFGIGLLMLQMMSGAYDQPSSPGTSGPNATTGAGKRDRNEKG